MSRDMSQNGNSIANDTQTVRGMETLLQTIRKLFGERLFQSTLDNHYYSTQFYIQSFRLYRDKSILLLECERTSPASSLAKILSPPLTPNQYIFLGIPWQVQFSPCIQACHFKSVASKQSGQTDECHCRHECITLSV